ncbi:kinase-like domain-containing protein [Xylaria arbuscula]|nr:kinase-like domain-containing protein [Xylaria arbuscula]
MPPNQPIAQIFCRYIDKKLPKHYQRGIGFHQSTHHFANCCESIEIDLYPNQQVQVGREVEINEIAIIHPYVSRRHFIIYSIEYEADMQPLLYVRDTGSLGGTYVDGPCSRRTKVSSSSGYLLSQSEIIRIVPYWEFHIYLLGTSPTSSMLDQIRKNNARLGGVGFLVKERLLGNGALAAVHLAVNLKSGRQLACKIHRLDHFQQLPGYSSTIRRILDETNILSRVAHVRVSSHTDALHHLEYADRAKPNLLKFVAAFRSSNILYTFTELAMGGDLFSIRLRYQDGLPEMDIKFIIRQILEAIHYLHQHQIAHRDLKPENIFLATGPTLPARIIVGDLGFAKAAASGRMTSSVGTERFIAPEVYSGQSYGREVDIWSVGMISLFLTTSDWGDLGCGKFFDQDTVDDSLTTTFGELYRRNKALSQDFMDFIRRCLSVKSSDRLTAEDSRDHPWFISSRSQLKHLIQKTTKYWKPSPIVHNSVQDLDLFDDAPHTVPTGKTKGDESDNIENIQQSHYFLGDSTRSETQQLVPNSLVIKLTTPNGDTVHYLNI